MSDEDHVVTARAVYDLAADRYVQFVGTQISSATEGPIDRSVLEAFVELIKRRRVIRIADVGCGPGRVAAFMAERGLDVVGVDVSLAMLEVARTAHPKITFEQGRLDALPIETGVLAGAVCWYSIIYTPPDRLTEAFDELKRVLIPGGYVLLAFQAEGNAVYRADSYGTGLPLTSYRHGVQEIADCLEDTGFKIYSTVLRSPELDAETTAQGFVIASSPPSWLPSHGSSSRRWG
jgi:ubiquinone/menaquinone biosynthesis C-methylase UbiE